MEALAWLKVRTDIKTSSWGCLFGHVGKPACLAKAGDPWRGFYAPRHGLATNLIRMTTQKKIPTVVVLLVLLVIAIIAANISSNIKSSAPTQAPYVPAQHAVHSDTSFGVKARARFDNVLSVSPELSGISCEGGDCTSVIYFDYKTVPEDLEFAIRGNAATFSKFKMENTGVSHVTVAARKNGQVFFSCNAASGVVSECNSY